MEHEGNVRLIGWKEIATHLRVTVRTAQLWEKTRELPIHRYPGDGKPRVYAYPDELESWGRDSAGQGHRLQTSRPGSLIRSRIAIIAVVVAVAVAIAVRGSIARIWMAVTADQTAPVRCLVENQVLMVFDSQDDLIWQRPLPGFSSDFSSKVSHEPCRVLDADADNRPEVYLDFIGTEWPSESGKLVCLDDRGEKRWERSYGRLLRAGERRFGASFMGNQLRTLRVDGQPRLLATATHWPYYPAEAALIDPRTGETLETYYHPGNFYDLTLGDVDGDGTHELLIGAVNNPGLGPGHPALVILDLPFSGPDGSRRVPVDYFGNPGPKELAYYVFPRSDIDDAIAVQARVWEIGAPGDGPLSVVVSSPNGELAYSLDVTDFLRPTVTNVAAATNFRQSHDHLADEGLVQHRLGDQLPEAHWRVLVYETAPDGNSPDLALAFEMNPLVSQQSHD